VLSITAAAGVAAACATLINALRVAISISEGLRRSTDGAYFGWAKDWPLFAGYVLAVTIIATAIAPFLTLIPILCERTWRPLRK
jgi:hypothetical protein